MDVDCILWKRKEGKWCDKFFFLENVRWSRFFCEWQQCWVLLCEIRSWKRRVLLNKFKSVTHIYSEFICNTRPILLKIIQIFVRSLTYGVTDALEIFLEFHRVKSRLWFVDTRISRSEKSLHSNDEWYAEGSTQHMYNTGLWYSTKCYFQQLSLTLEIRFNWKLFQLNELNFHFENEFALRWRRRRNIPHLNINHFR